ncbi:hypothetical protein LJ753_16600 [Arthrobacter sp. zg-Y20]|uniref:hypothetical protein n=1 Tax=unclassified Arthrobacter TaxID=235627 RepID=UPI001D1498DA|nr:MULTISPECIES: hypothetical protein [unclassified Arthrobacter]MCC3277485.1 hypothetical protein [Arthrobacter sp. zg-Y20]MDK1317646.1 hypothetical protein [Arthrobacter sp. zg.Y20]WIB07094.1 hypothetical protein QNO06_05020 [Arthrobacter sp. zg-Y20]
MSKHQEEAKKTLGRLITAGYKAKGDTRQSAAKEMGMASRSLYALEVGEVAVPRRYTQERLEKFLGWRRGAIADLLSAGPGVDLDRVTLDTMRAEPSAEWVAAGPADVDETARRIQEDAQALSNRLRERDRTVESLESELKQERERTDKLQEDLHHALEALRAEQKRSAALANGYDLAADTSPNRGAELRAVLDEVAEGNRNVGGRG